MKITQVLHKYLPIITSILFLGIVAESVIILNYYFTHRNLDLGTKSITIELDANDGTKFQENFQTEDGLLGDIVHDHGIISGAQPVTAPSEQVLFQFASYTAGIYVTAMAEFDSKTQTYQWDAPQNHEAILYYQWDNQKKVWVQPNLGVSDWHIHNGDIYKFDIEKF
ncbi:hypothetical protein ASO20_02385 [Mycoplasma sp. (ex Biomphalaria glabrata)]|uniref:hypothetical protein n=1 Tax=Mycoplasma sp. (ex Biomphalaria glabrata) TaxID=1749074 RepID=UPI00073A8EB7|nr:hypothetical protein [Mycoplasma sp. (ex Biomphalaria glabrata)]ALV23482.1 hypothetical protein ASO20_02385 [Mycoplasma sp. (ex Biomphalaria glabrata)]